MSERVRLRSCLLTRIACHRQRICRPNRLARLLALPQCPNECALDGLAVAAEQFVLWLLTEYGYQHSRMQPSMASSPRIGSSQCPSVVLGRLLNSLQQSRQRGGILCACSGRRSQQRRQANSADGRYPFSSFERRESLSLQACRLRHGLPKLAYSANGSGT